MLLKISSPKNRVIFIDGSLFTCACLMFVSLPVWALLPDPVDQEDILCLSFWNLRLPLQIQH